MWAINEIPQAKHFFLFQHQVPHINPKGSLLGCACSWWYWSNRNLGHLLLPYAHPTFPEGNTLEMYFLQRWRADLHICPIDSCTCSSLKALQKPLQRKQLLTTAPDKWKVSVLGRAHSSLKLSSQVLWLGIPARVPWTVPWLIHGKQSLCFSLLFCQCYWRYFSQRQEKRTSFFFCRNLSFFFSSYFFPLLLSTKSTSHKIVNWSSRIYQNKNFQ